MSKSGARRLVNKVNENVELLQRVSYLEQFEEDYYIMKDRYNALISFLTKFLQETVHITTKDEKSIREQISRLLVANTQPIDSIILDKYGYIKEIKQANVLVKHRDYPKDILWGYYYLDENYNIVCDEERKLKRYEVL